MRISDGCICKSTIKFDVHLGGSGRLQTLTEPLLLLASCFNYVCIIDNIYNFVVR